MSARWDNWLERLYNLRRDKTSGHERPHKPVLLLSIIDLIDRGRLARNEVLLSDELIVIFRGLFKAVCQANDQPSIQNPFFHLSGDKFWELVPVAGETVIYRPGATAGAPSVAELRRRVAYGRFDDGLWALLSDPVTRHQLREALIARYFPERREQIAAVLGAGARLAQPDALREELPPGRDAAFRWTILEIYDFTCAACGIRLVLHSGLSLVEAAHIIPFSVAWNDRPTNGLALCPNHHWAMDRHLIAPCPDDRHRGGVWRVNRQLDDRLHGQRDLILLSGRPVIPPHDKEFYPAEEGLRWREEHLTTVY
ncbi:MAG TPA: HNH endonuclease [Candidatus Paceibacterota bacterium]|nr:HNH endonuclease [Verrucomicrobiota bacterium]HRZ44969.1 HNH endonuclease [Candidatus Paceibacterota bacterium]HRZ94850.1 HNH endonuclease [Candidatus Paceibacterota bacterium]